jgi:hypothetical protein
LVWIYPQKTPAVAKYYEQCVVLFTSIQHGGKPSGVRDCACDLTPIF